MNKADKDKKGKHKDCQYLVLDLVHDKYALPALIAYIEACEEEYPRLAEDLFKLIAKLEELKIKILRTLIDSGEYKLFFKYNEKVNP
jgi:phage terminase large subunit-like protein